MMYDPTPEQPPILVDLRDRVFGATTIKQRALFKRLVHQDEPGNPSVRIDVSVQLYAQAATGGYGERLQGNGFRDYPRELFGDNNAAVDPNDGTILLMRSHEERVDGQGKRVFTPVWPEESEVDFRARCVADERTVVLQGKFFLLLRDYSSIEIGDLIRTHIAQADEMGRFA